MKKWLRNTVMGLGIAAAGVVGGGYVTKGYRDYKIPEVIQTKNEGDIRINIYRHKENLFYEPIARLAGEYNRDSYVVKVGNSFWMLNVDTTIFEENAQAIYEDWEKYKLNALLPKGDPNWDPRKQAAYNVLKDFKESEIKSKYLELCIEATIAHEKTHIIDSGRNLSDLESETSAFSSELKEHPITLDILEGLKKRRKNGVHKQAAGDILKKLYGDDPWTFYHKGS